MPEASVMRRVQTLSGFIGRKELRRLFSAFCLKYSDLIGELDKIWLNLMIGEGAGTYGVAVKCVDIIGNTKGVGRHLGRT